MASFDPGALRFRITVQDEAAAAALRPYVEKYCTSKQLGNLASGKLLSLNVPSATAATELYLLIFAYGTPARLAQLHSVIVASGRTPPTLPLTEDHDIGWLFMGQYENALRRGNIQKVGDLTAITELDLYSIAGVTIKGIALAKNQLAEHGLSLKTD